MKHGLMKSPQSHHNGLLLLLNIFPILGRRDKTPDECHRGPKSIGYTSNRSAPICWDSPTGTSLRRIDPFWTCSAYLNRGCSSNRTRSFPAGSTSISIFSFRAKSNIIVVEKAAHPNLNLTHKCVCAPSLARSELNKDGTEMMGASRSAAVSYNLVCQSSFCIHSTNR